MVLIKHVAVGELVLLTSGAVCVVVDFNTFEATVRDAQRGGEPFQVDIMQDIRHILTTRDIELGMYHRPNIMVEGQA